MKPDILKSDEELRRDHAYEQAERFGPLVIGLFLMAVATVVFGAFHCAGRDMRERESIYSRDCGGDGVCYQECMR